MLWLGYVLLEVMLLKIKAVMSKTNVPIKTGESTYIYPKAFILSDPMIAINAVAPPGGCRVLVICIIIMADETARGATIQMISGANL